MKKQYKNAIAMIMAITVVIIIGTIMALGLALTTQTANRNLDMYLYEQAEILADSAREYTMYKIGKNPCIVSGYNIPNQDNFYDVNISVKYVTPTGCTASPALNYIPSSNPNHSDSNLSASSAIIDVTISIDKSETTTNENIRFYKRYIETIKP